MTLVTSEAILLRSHEYSESSRIFRFLTPDMGIVSLIGKGVRRRGARGEAAIQTFSEGSLTFFHKRDRDLHTLRELHPSIASLDLGRDVRRFAGASLIAEFLLVHSLEEGDPELYGWVRDVLRRLATAEGADVIGWILAGGWRTLSQFGFPPGLSECVRCEGELCRGDVGAENMDRFDVAAGGVVCSACSAGSALPRIGPLARQDLGLLVQGIPPTNLRGGESHLLMLEGFATHHLAPRHRLKSFATLRSLLNKMEG